MTPLTRRPIVGLGLVFIAGTWLGLMGSLPVPLLIAATAILLACTAAAIMFFERNIPATANGFLFAGCFSIACLNARLDSLPAASPDAATIVSTNETIVGLIGIVDDTPTPASEKNGMVLWKFPLAAEQMQPGVHGDWRDVSGSVRVSLYAPAARPPRYGERWHISGRPTARPRHGGDILTLAATSRDADGLSRGHGNRFVAWCLDWRQRIGSLLTLGISDFREQTAILMSLLLGYRSQMPFDLYQAFAATGTLHVFAISGSHVVVLGGAIIFAVAACGVRRTHWIFILGPLLILYTVMTGLQPSAVRACIMGMLFWLAPLFGRKPDIYASLAASAILILAVVPSDLLNIGFILSFVAVLGLVLLYRPIYAPMEQRLSADPLRLQAESWWVRALRFGGKQVAGLVAMSAAACLATAPLTAWYFGTVSPISLLGNLVAVPLASLVIVTGAISLVLGSVASVLADIFNHANLVIVTLMAASTRLLAQMPGGYFRVSPPPLWMIAAFYAALVLWRFRLWVKGYPQPVPPPSEAGSRGLSDRGGGNG